MINIYEYIINKNTKVVKNSDFKQFETKEEVCDFFENKGFEKNEFSDYSKMLDKFEKSKTPLFYIDKDKNYNEWLVRFGKGGKNEIFFCRIPEIEKGINYEVCDYKDIAIYDYDNFEDFKKYVTNYFGW
jgi:hypothetical protein